MGCIGNYKTWENKHFEVLSAITVVGGIACVFCATLGVEARVGFRVQLSASS
jgi:hypothetical protein